MKTFKNVKLGLFDKEGTEIREGDILEFPHPWEKEKTVTKIIVFKHTLRDGIGFYEQEYNHVPDGEYYRRAGKVIGNIHDTNKMAKKYTVTGVSEK